MTATLSWRVAAAVLIVALAGCSSESPERLLSSAKALIAKADRKGAVIELKRAIDAGESTGEARLLLGRLLLEDGNATGAEIELRKASEAGAPEAKVLPELVRAMLARGEAARIVAQFGRTTLGEPAAQADLLATLAEAQLQVGNRDAAVRALDEALKLQPGFAPALVGRARLEVEDGQIDTGLATLESVLAKDAGNERAGLAKAHLLWIGRGDPAGAVTAYRAIVQAHPRSARARSELVNALFQQGQLAEARQELQQLKQVAPADPQGIFFDALFAYADKDFKRSRELTDILISAMPSHYRALELAALAEYGLRNDAAAEGFLVSAVKVAPGRLIARRLLAEAYLRTGRADRVLETLAPVIDGARPDPESLAIAGAAYLETGNAGRADAAFKKAAALAPNDVRVRTSAALASVGAGQVDAAVRELEKVASASQDARADIALISTLVGRGDLRGALKAIDGLERKLPGRPMPLQLRGQVQQALGDVDSARRSFEAALAASGNYLPAAEALARLELASGQTKAAADRIDAYLKANPRTAGGYILRAEIAQASLEAPAEVLRFLSEAVRAEPGSALAHLALYRQHVRMGDAKAALAAAQAGAAALPNDLALLETLGQAQMAAGESQQAVATFTKLVTQRPRDPRSLLMLAEAHQQARDAASARRALDRALELDPDFLGARYGLAMLAVEAGRLDEAAAAAKEMQRRRPKAGLGFTTEGDIEVRRRNWKAAVAAYREAMQVEPSSEVAVKLHSVLRVAGSAADADRVAADWERKRPRDPVFRYYLGDVATQAKNYPAAEAYYREVLAQQPANALALNNVAWLTLQQGKPGALDLAMKADSLMPNRAPILDTLAAAQAASGQTALAIETQQRAVAAAPQQPGLKLALAKLYLKAGDQKRAREQLQQLEKLGTSFPAHAEVSELLRTL